MRTGPPRLPSALLRKVVPPEWREPVLRDLEELWTRRRQSHSRLRADLWYIGQALSFALRFGTDRLARGRLPELIPGGRELGSAVRSLLRSPLHSALVVMTLAVGVGTVTAMYSVLRQVVLRPLPVERPERVVVAWHDHRLRDFAHYPFDWASWSAAREGVGSFEVVAATESRGSVELLVGEEGEERVLRWSRVVGDFFGLLGVEPVAGRALRPGDDVAGGPRVAVVSEGLWERRFGRAPAAIGSTLRLDGQSWTVVGVMPHDFDFPRGTEVWSPLHPFYADAAAARERMELDLIARLAPGPDVPGVVAELGRVYGEHPDLRESLAGAVPVVRPFPDVVLGDVRPTLLLLFWGSMVVLGVALANVASLVLVRADRRKELLAVRRALGAGGWRLAGEAAAEGLVLGTAGWLVGGALAAAALHLLVPLAPASLPRIDQVGLPSPGTFLATGSMSVLLLLAVTLVPLARGRRAPPSQLLRAGGRSAVGGPRLGRHTMVVGQIALAAWVVAAGALAGRGLRDLLALDPGFEVEGLVLVELDVPHALFEIPDDYPERLARVGRHIDALVGVEGVTPVLDPPLTGPGGHFFTPRLEGQSREEALDGNPLARVEVVQEDVLRVLELPLVRGRPVVRADDAGSERVVLVNQTAARAFWPGEDPLGKRLEAPYPGVRGEPWTVVGVVGDTRWESLADLRPTVLFPHRQLNLMPLRHLAVRTGSPGVPVAEAVRDALAAEAPALRLRGVTTVRSRMDGPLARPRFATLVLAVFGGATLLLAVTGVYGMMASLVASRTPEMGVRMACGAAPARIRRMILGRAGTVAAIGVAVGLAATLLSAGLLRVGLPDAPPPDLPTLLAPTLVVLLAALAACWLPAYRASRIDPVRVLRGE